MVATHVHHVRCRTSTGITHCSYRPSQPSLRLVAHAGARPDSSSPWLSRASVRIFCSAQTARDTDALDACELSGVSPLVQPIAHAHSGTLPKSDFTKFVEFFRKASPYIQGHVNRTFVVVIPGLVSCMAPHAVRLLLLCVCVRLMRMDCRDLFWHACVWIYYVSSSMPSSSASWQVALRPDLVASVLQDIALLHGTSAASVHWL